jgi:hypothetical protein
MITSWVDEEDKVNAKYDSIRDKCKHNTGGNNNNNNNNKDQGGHNNYYLGPNRKCKPNNTIAAIQRPAKDNSKKTSGGFKDSLKVSVASGGQPHHRAVLPTPASTQRYPRPTAS